MGFIPTPIEGLLIFEPAVFRDARGYFFESFREDHFLEEGIHTRFIQDNEAASSYGVIRGLHYQTGDKSQAKLVRVSQGEVLDVVVDLRPGSSTYGQHYSVVLNDENKRQLYVPRGFAHGYAVLSERAIFQYKCDNYYAPGHEGGVLLSDPSLDIDWRIPEKDRIISEKDKLWPAFGQHRSLES